VTDRGIELASLELAGVSASSGGAQPFVCVSRMDPSDLKSRLGLAVFDNAPCLVAVLDRDLRIAFSNRAFHTAFGQHDGDPCYTVYKGLDHPCAVCPTRRTFTDARSLVSEEEGVDREGNPLCYQVKVIPVFGADGQHVEHALQMALDTTRTMDLERMLEQAERLANVGLTTAGLAHTIKNILAGLDGGMYMVRTGLEKTDGDRLQAGWGMVEKYVEQVTALVRNLLRYARAERPKPVQAEPCTLVRDAVELYQSKADLVGIDLEGNVEEGLPEFVIDLDAITASVTNLVSNAMDACTWDPDTDKQHRITVAARAGEEGRIRIEVADNGMGIAEEDQRKILKTYFTTKGMRGTGLGLLLTKKAVEQHGGAIGFASTPGQGATFWIEIPASKMAATADEKGDVGADIA